MVERLSLLLKHVNVNIKVIESRDIDPNDGG